jgi:hypothetical protein
MIPRPRTPLRSAPDCHTRVTNWRRVSQEVRAEPPSLTSGGRSAPMPSGPISTVPTPAYQPPLGGVVGACDCRRCVVGPCGAIHGGAIFSEDGERRYVRGGGGNCVVAQLGLARSLVFGWEGGRGGRRGMPKCAFRLGFPSRVTPGTYGVSNRYTAHEFGSKCAVMQVARRADRRNPAAARPVSARVPAQIDRPGIGASPRSDRPAGDRRESPLPSPAKHGADQLPIAGL